MPKDIIKHKAMKAEGTKKIRTKDTNTMKAHLKEENRPKLDIIKHKALEAEGTKTKTEKSDTMKAPLKAENTSKLDIIKHKALEAEGTKTKTEKSDTMKAPLKAENTSKLKPKRARKRRAPRIGRRNKKSKSAKKSRDEAAENKNDNIIIWEDDCAAAPCKRPNSGIVDWVRCDGGCQLWFHLVCIGLTKNDVSANEDYVCSQCK